jgi:AbrB family looped-hinge helix DNA binding protein
MNGNGRTAAPALQTALEKSENGFGNAISNGRMVAMTATITIDKAGRLVLPKVMRDKLRLRAGSRLTVDLVGDKIELAEAMPEARIERRKDGLPVVVGWEGFDAAKAVREMRADQVARLDASYDQ